MSGPPAVLFDSLYAGGTSAKAGQTGQVILDLPPGEWIAWWTNAEAPQVPVMFTVTGKLPTCCSLRLMLH